MFDNAHSYGFYHITREHIQTQKPRYSQFCYWACCVSANWLQSDWWHSERCLYNANFRLRVLTIMRYQRPVWR